MKCDFRLIDERDGVTGLYKCTRCKEVLPLPIGVGETVARVCPVDRQPLPLVSCDYRGEFTGTSVDCGCTQDTRIFECSHPENSLGQAVLNKPTVRTKWNDWVCKRCKHNKVLPEIKTRNLLYHCCPLKSNDLWRNNVRQLLDHGHVFNGRRLMAVSTGVGLHDVQEVRKELGDFAELMPIPNDKQLREVVSFLPLLCGVANTRHDEATFYAHSKGNSTADSVKGATYWRNAGYRHLLGGFAGCMDHLRKFKAVGIHQMVYPDQHSSPFPTKLSHGRWMFAGTFFWFRNDAVFDKVHWRKIPIDRYGAEAWLSGLFEPHEVHSVYQKWPVDQYPTPSPYDPRLYQGEEITDEEVERMRSKGRGQQ